MRSKKKIIIKVPESTFTNSAEVFWLPLFRKFQEVSLPAEENSCNSSDAVWMNREQSVSTPMMMHSPHLTSTVLRDPKRMRPEESCTAAFFMPTEQHHQQPATPQQQPLHQHQAAIDYKYKQKTNFAFVDLSKCSCLLSLFQQYTGDVDAGTEATSWSSSAPRTGQHALRQDEKSHAASDVSLHFREHQ